MPRQTIVIGVDFGEPSLIAARWVARQFGADAELVLTHAVHFPTPPSFLAALYAPVEASIDDACVQSESRLRTFAASLGAPRVRTEVRVGRPEDVLGQAVDANGADLLVVGPRRQQHGLRQLLGNIAERALRRSRASVLLARNVPAGPPAHVLVGFDESPLLPAVIEAARTLSGGDPSRVVGLYVASSMAYEAAPTAVSAAEHRDREREVRARAEAWIARQLAETELRNARAVVAFGDPGMELLEVARGLGECVIVLGRNGGDTANERFFGRATEFVLGEGEGPVWVVSDAG